MALERLDSTYTRGTHIIFRNLGHMNGSRGYQRKTNIYDVVERGNLAARLGRVLWFGRWRKYVFQPFENTVYEETCMREISQFIEEETAAQRVTARLAKTSAAPVS